MDVGEVFYLEVVMEGKVVYFYVWFCYLWYGNNGGDGGIGWCFWGLDFCWEIRVWGWWFYVFYGVLGWGVFFFGGVLFMFCVVCFGVLFVGEGGWYKLE